ncbi:unnamed protein product [Knipowitschia caucasica]
MPWFMGAAFIPKFDGDKAKFVDWKAQVEAMIRAQGLSDLQQADFVLAALEGEAKQEIQLVDPRDKNTGKKMLDYLQKLYSKPATKSQLRTNFYNCRQRADENVNSFILRLRDLFSKWSNIDDVATGDRDELLLEQFTTGLRKGPVKQELNRLMRRDPMVFTEACKEARALEKEQDEEGEDILAQRVRTHTHNTTPNLNPNDLKGQLHAELKEELMGEIKKEILDHLRALSTNLVEEVKAQLRSPTLPHVENDTPPGQHDRWDTQKRPTRPQDIRTPARVRQPVRSAYQWDDQGRPICRHCGTPGHFQRTCPHKFPPNSDF